MFVKNFVTLKIILIIITPIYTSILNSKNYNSKISMTKAIGDVIEECQLVT